MLEGENPIHITSPVTVHLPTLPQPWGCSRDPHAVIGVWFLLWQPDSPRADAQVLPLAVGHPRCHCFARCKDRLFVPTQHAAADYNAMHGAALSQDLQAAKPELLMSNSRFRLLGHWKPCFQFWLALRRSASRTRGGLRREQKARLSLQCTPERQISVCVSARPVQRVLPLAKYRNK